MASTSHASGVVKDREEDHCGVAFWSEVIGSGQPTLKASDGPRRSCSFVENKCLVACCPLEGRKRVLQGV